MSENLEPKSPDHDDYIRALEFIAGAIEPAIKDEEAKLASMIQEVVAEAEGITYSESIIHDLGQLGCSSLPVEH